MWPDRVSIPGPLTYESGALPTALRGTGPVLNIIESCYNFFLFLLFLFLLVLPTSTT